MAISDAIGAREPTVFMAEEAQTNHLLDAVKLHPVTLTGSSSTYVGCVEYIFYQKRIIKVLVIPVLIRKKSKEPTFVCPSSVQLHQLPWLPSQGDRLMFQKNIGTASEVQLTGPH